MNLDSIHTAHLVRMFVIVTLMLFCGCESARRDAPVADSGCYGFIRQGAVVLNCSGQLQATSDLGIEGFAVSPDGNWLALMRSHDVPLDQYTFRLINESKLVDLRTKTITEIQFYPEILVSSCGKLFAFDDSKGMHDLIARVGIFKLPYTMFRCSEDEALIAGYTGRKEYGRHLGRRLLTGYPPRTISAFNDYLAFDVSANGEYIAFTATNGRDGVVSRICMTRKDQSVECVESLSISGPIMSVSDSGHALFEQHTEQECIYRDHTHFAPNSEKKEENLDACVGIFRWQVGQREAEEIEPLGREPQWIPNASLLKEWMRQPVRL